MKRMIFTVVCVSLAGLVGCDKGTSVAPATNAAKPEAQRKLTVTSPGEQNITQDQSDDMTISIGRTNFDAPVTIEMRNLPTGVKVTTKEMTIPAGKDSVVVTVKADPTAPAVNDHQVAVAAKAPDMAEAVTTFKMDVKAKK
jgi:hypothetical protein